MSKQEIFLTYQEPTLKASATYTCQKCGTKFSERADADMHLHIEHGFAHPNQSTSRPMSRPTVLDMDDTVVVRSRLPQVFEELEGELTHATQNWPAFNSAHEGFAILLEEVDELKAHVWTNQKKRDLKAMRKEAIQVAAMAVRFALDVTDETSGRK